MMQLTSKRLFWGGMLSDRPLFETVKKHVVLDASVETWKHPYLESVMFDLLPHRLKFAMMVTTEPSSGKDVLMPLMSTQLVPLSLTI